VTELTTDQAPLRDAPVSSLLIVGVGLVGGSIARAARATYPGLRLVGTDRGTIGGPAVDGGFVDAFVAADDADAVADAIISAGMVLITLPVLSTIAFVEQHADLLRNVVATDTAASKRDVTACASRLGLPRFVGGHPMFPRSHGGLASADGRLIEGTRWFLCADDAPDAIVVEADAIARVRALLSGLGALPVELGASEHDRDVALTSHVPHLLANVLAEAVLQAGAVDAAGASLRDILRVAGAPFDVWGDTVQTNRAAIAAALDDVIERLRGLSGQLGERDRVRELFASGRALRERLHG
jgi:prephenate dehydrogenase